MIHFLHACTSNALYMSAHISHPLVQSSFSYETQQLVIDQAEVLLAGIDDGDNDIMTDGFLRVMGTHLQIFWLEKEEKDMCPQYCSGNKVTERIELQGRGRVKMTQWVRKTKTQTQAKAHLSGLWPGQDGSWGSGWQTWHILASLEHGCHWT